ncbi:MAG: protein translocase subunit SecD [Pseudomonadota bacterium]|uniref:protein translocase subunit SecD n=1 Tax=Pseudohongiella sp. O18 TaxID=2904248 RepID=UPI000C450684|nr:protein translocase subunit SecD [Pseudohongiella sp. O18]MAY54345.1 protein translocase subunit SecD [Gammaproteobacteria bacterium]MBJ55987.1 protein translocase subunit SecD [Gammaproteobacteria bacterium]MEC8858906.1 protein translocase subunit SecD [Pseudomonadota bacterium]HBN15424.1 protein translocase subunit SecD [Pseudohongiella sp.]
MLNKFPLWKNILVATVVALGLIYASPNLFPDDPALQISHENREVTDIDLGMATDALRAAGIEYFGDELTDLGGLIRFYSLDDQLRAKSTIEQNLEGDYIVALNLAPTTPGFLQAVGAGKMNLGLDLQGGVHFLMEVDMETAQRRRMENTMNSIRQELRNERIRSRNLSLENINLIEARFEDEESRSQARTLIRENFADLQVIAREQGGDYLLEMSLTAEDLDQMRQDTVTANQTSIRNRVDSLGVAEPVVQQQGPNRIVVELPGVQDTAQAKRILQRIATLQFHLEAEPGAPTTSYETYEYQGQRVNVDNTVILQGDRISNVRSALDQYGQPQVVINLDAQGGQQFNRVTRENIGNLMDILLIETRTRTVFEEDADGNVVERQETYEERRLISHAVIRAALGREFVITGLSQQEANDLSLLIRSGALAAPMYFIEERTVGPSLGAENIEQGSRAVMLGYLLVLSFMLYYYRLFGLAANIALVINVVLLVSIMSIISATLTLPGIFGIVLTIGMAVDANVLIFTRIREEIVSGLSPQNAISAGFDRAFSTIVDANLTTFLVAMVLFSVGTGPVKGFAVTLMVGIMTSMFSAIMVTRFIVNLMYGGRKVDKLSIGPFIKAAEAQG